MNEEQLLYEYNTDDQLTKTKELHPQHGLPNHSPQGNQLHQVSVQHILGIKFEVQAFTHSSA